MPHVADYLNPKAEAQQDGSARTLATARLWQLNNDLDQTYGLGRRADWTLLAQNQYEISFRLGQGNGGTNAVQMVLFQVGVGMLVVQAAPKSEQLADWLDFLHYFRISDGRRKVRVCATRRIGKDQVEPFFPEPAGGVAAHPAGEGLLDDVLTALLRTGSADESAKNWWEEVFVPGKLLPFAALYVDGLENEAAAVRYRLRHFFRAGQEIIPCASDLCEEHASVLPYADRQWFVFSIEGGAFLACDAPCGFFRETMPDHLRKDYFLLFLMALHQRFALVRMSAQVARHWPLGGAQDEQGREDIFQDIRDTLLAFTARGYFAQVMQRDNHHRVYRKWQEVFQVERLYDEVRDEVREMHEYLLKALQEEQRRLADENFRQLERAEREAERREREANRRMEMFGLFITILGLAFAVPALTFGFFSMNVDAYFTSPHKEHPLMVALAAVGGSVLVILGIAIVWRYVTQPKMGQENENCAAKRHGKENVETHGR